MRTTVLSRMLLGGQAVAPIPMCGVRVHRMRDTSTRPDLDPPDQRKQRQARLAEIEQVVMDAGPLGILAVEIGDLTGVSLTTVNDILRALTNAGRIRRQMGSGARASRYFGGAA